MTATSVLDSTALLFLDLETDGNDIKVATPLEVAWCLWHPRQRRYLTPLRNLSIVPDNLEELVAGMEPIVLKMHTESNLLSELRALDPSIYSLKAAENAILDDVELVRGMGVNTIHLAGMGVASFDHNILRRTMPGLAAELHYRTQDASVMRHAAQLISANLPAGVWPFVEPYHRAAQDVSQGVDTYAYFQRALEIGCPAATAELFAANEHLLEPKELEENRS